VNFQRLSRRVRLDTNVFVYAYLENPKKSEDYAKHIKAQELLRSFTAENIVFIST
jgi:predicted nucleic acid-binding protein